MFNIYEVTKQPGGESFIIEMEGNYLLFDSGFAFCAEQTAKNIRNVIGDNPLQYILLSHSHYDHVMGSVQIKKAFPDAQIVSHTRVAKIFEKESARNTMQELDIIAAKKKGMAPNSTVCESLAIDIEVDDGDCIPFANGEIYVITTPGHTKCSVSYYFPKEDLIALSETTGLIYDAPEVMPEFVSSYSDTIKSIDKVVEVNPRYILMLHRGLITESERNIYLKNAMGATVALKNFILKLYDDDFSVDYITQRCKEILYKGSYSETQPAEAFILNRKAMVVKLIEEQR